MNPTGDSPGTDVEVRVLTGLDVNRVLQLDRESRMSLNNVKGGPAWLAEHPSLDGLLSGAETTCLVAVLAEAIIGFALTVDRIDPIRGRICEVDRVYVDERGRDIGCGDALLAEVIASAVRRSCLFIEADVLPGDRASKNLYERASMTARRITVSKSLSAPSTEGVASR